MDYDKLIAPAAAAMRPSGIRKFFDLAAEMPECISLGVGEPDFKTPWAVREAGIESLEHGRTRYTSNAGLKELRAEIGHILGVDNNHHLIMIGVGNLGHALLQNFPFSQSGFTVDAAFDVSPAVIGTVVNNVPVYAMSELDHFLQDHPVDVVVLTIPQSVAQDTASHLINLGVKGFWNFTNIELSSQLPDVQFENIHFADSLLTLSYRIANR